jgi:uncharacterized membrane protein (DUF485 family)
MLKKTRFSAADVLQAQKFRELTSARATLRWTLSLATLALFFGFILLVLSARSVLGTSSPGSIPVWFNLSFAMVFLVVILTGVYVRRSNARFDQLTNDLNQEFGQ